MIYRKIHRILLPLFILLVCGAVYAPTLGYSFVYDDHGQILNSRYALSWDWLPKYFTGHLWSFKPLTTPVYYRPMFLVWFLLNYQLFGVDPMWWHLTTVLAHLTVTLLVYQLGWRMLRDPIAAGVAALLFGVHPVHIESVAWVSGVSDPLMSMFLLGSLLCYLRFSEEATRGRPRWLAASLALAGLALLAKETAVILPGLVFAHAALFGEREASAMSKRRVRAAALVSIPYAILDVAYLGVRTAVLGGTLATTINPLPVGTMVATWPGMFCFYAQQLIAPIRLSLFYFKPYVTSIGWTNFWVPVLAIVAIGLGLLAWSRRSRVAAFSAALMVLPILPVIYLRAYTVDEVVHDRYLYLPSAGFCLLAALAWTHLPKRLGMAALVIAAVGLSAATLRQSRFWHDDIGLFTRGYQVAPMNYLAQQNLGVALVMQQRFSEAIPLLQAALARDAYSDASAYTLGRCYLALEEYPEAEVWFRRSTEINPREPNARFYLGVVELREGHLEAAESDIREALRLRPAVSPESRLFHLMMAEVLERKGDLRGALGEYEKELEENPESPKAQERRAALRATLLPDAR